MQRKNTADYVRILAEKYFPGKYNPSSQYISEMALTHSVKMVSIGGEQALNDANSRVEVGVSDFNGTLTPTDAKGLVRALTVGFGISNEIAAPSSPALVKYAYQRSAFPAWLLNSELILKIGNVEAIRIRVSDLVIGTTTDRVVADWAKELEKTIKCEGGQDLQILLSTPKGAAIAEADGKHQYIQVNLYGIKFGDRKSN